MITKGVRPIEDLKPGEPVVVFENVSIGFEGKTVLKNISFEVDRGQTMIILGPAGCGKSVLMKLANGLLSPDSGKITVFGQEISAMSERQMFQLREHIGMVFQESALFDSLSVEDNVAYRLHEEHMPEGAKVRGTGSSNRQIPLRTLRRNAASRIDCACDHYSA